jgi:hypothetical protein
VSSTPTLLFSLIAPYNLLVVYPFLLFHGNEKGGAATECQWRKCAAASGTQAPQKVESINAAPLTIRLNDNCLLHMLFSYLSFDDDLNTVAMCNHQVSRAFGGTSESLDQRRSDTIVCRDTLPQSHSFLAQSLAMARIMYLLIKEAMLRLWVPKDCGLLVYCMWMAMLECQVHS